MSGSSILFPKKGFKRQDYTTPGTYNFVVPAGVTEIHATIVGGGGGGGAGVAGGPADGASGGGGGGVSQCILEAVAGETWTIVVGAGGASLTVPSNAEDGGLSSVTTPRNYVPAFGGIGGEHGGGGAINGGGPGGFGGSGLTQNGGRGQDSGLFGATSAEGTFFNPAGNPGAIFGSQNSSGAGGASLGRGGDAGVFGSANNGFGQPGERGSGGGGSHNQLASGGDGGDGVVYLKWVAGI